jgi:uncharacterized protein
VFVLVIVLALAGGLLTIPRARSGQRLLFRASRGGQRAIVKALVALGSPVNARDENGGTALFYAAANGHSETVRSLLALGADATAADNQGNTALCSALDTATPNDGIVELLATNGALAKQAQHGSPLFCIEHSASSVPYIELLLKLGVDADASGSDSYAPLMKFAYDGNPGAVAALIQHGAMVNRAAKDGRTALSEAVVQGNDTVVEILLKSGADRTVRVEGLTLPDVAKNKKARFQEVSNQTMIRRYDRILQMLTATEIGSAKPWAE